MTKASYPVLSGNPAAESQHDFRPLVASGTEHDGPSSAVFGTVQALTSVDVVRSREQSALHGFIRLWPAGRAATRPTRSPAPPRGNSNPRGSEASGKPVPPEFTRTFPSPVELSFGVDDLSESVVDDQLTRDELARNRGLVLAEVVRTLMWLFGQTDEAAAERAKRLGLLVDLVAETWGRDELLAVLTYTISAFGPESAMRGIPLESASQETRQMYATMRDEFIAKGEAKGRAKGRAEGRAEGEAKGMARMVERLLLKRELVLTDELRDRLAGCEDEGLLQRWFDRSLTATTLTEVFDD